MSTRRTVLAGAGAGALALSGCASYGDTGAKTSAGQQPQNQKAGTVLAKVADVPVGGGKVLPDQNVVLTRPVPGTVKCFSAVCTHQGCTVADVSGGTINCPCHGSKFKVADGSVANGPAATPLPEVKIEVAGGEVKLA